MRTLICYVVLEGAIVTASAWLSIPRRLSGTLGKKRTTWFAQQVNWAITHQPWAKTSGALMKAS
jgi:hypothetical protein